MASFTVTFKDGTSHTYDNVPSNVTEDQVNERATHEFGDKEISGVSTAEAPEVTNPQGMGTYNQDTSLGQKAIATGQTAFNMANEFLGTPIGHAAEAAGAYKYGIKPTLDKYLQTRANLPTSVPTPAPAPNQIITPQNAGGVPRPQMPTGTPAQTFDTLRTPTPAPAPAAPPIGGPAAQQGSGFIQSLEQKFAPMARAVAPVLQKAAPYVQGASKMLAPAMIAKELFYTSPEEIAILKQAEAEKRAKGWRPINER
jgi:hypothetical protein